MIKKNLKKTTIWKKYIRNKKTINKNKKTSRKEIKHKWSSIHLIFKINKLMKTINRVSSKSFNILEIFAKEDD